MTHRCPLHYKALIANDYHYSLFKYKHVTVYCLCLHVLFMMALFVVAMRPRTKPAAWGMNWDDSRSLWAVCARYDNRTSTNKCQIRTSYIPVPSVYLKKVHIGTVRYEFRFSNFVAAPRRSLGVSRYFRRRVVESAVWKLENYTFIHISVFVTTSMSINSNSNKVFQIRLITR